MSRPRTDRPRGGKAPNSIDRQVGVRVRMRRLQLRMSQESLGNALGVTFQQVQKYEKGVNRIGAGRLQQISNVLQVPVSFFFEDVGRRPDEFVRNFMASRDGLALATAYRSLKSSDLKRKIVELVELIAEGEKSRR